MSVYKKSVMAILLALLMVSAVGTTSASTGHHHEHCAELADLTEVLLLARYAGARLRDVIELTDNAQARQVLVMIYDLPDPGLNHLRLKQATDLGDVVYQTCLGH